MKANPSIDSVVVAAERLGGMMLDDSWRQWIAENLMLGVSHESLLATLAAKGFAADVARREVAAAAGSPYVAGAQRLVNRLHKRDWLLETYRRLNRQLPAGDAVDVRSRRKRPI